MNSPGKLTVLVRDPGCGKYLRSSGNCAILREPDIQVAEHALNIIVLVAASALSEVAEFVQTANRRHQLKALLVHADIGERWIGTLLDRAQLRTLSMLLVHQGAEHGRRIVEAWRAGAQHQLIADAVALPDGLLVIGCDLKRLEVPFSGLPVLKKLNSVQRAALEVDPDGSFLYWPGADIHLDLAALRYAADPAFKAQAQAEALRSHARFGQAIAHLRARHNLSANSIPGVSERQLRRVEKGHSLPRSTTLAKLAKAHNLSLAAYLDLLAPMVRGS
jgi:hypothetical protein